MKQTTQTTNHPTPEEAPRLLRLPEVLSRTGIKASTTLYGMIRRGEFPKPLKVGRMSYWSAAAVHRWLDALEGGAA